MLSFKDPHSADEWADLHPTLRSVLLWLHSIWPTAAMVVTRIQFPTVAGESGVHQTSPHRAADVRTNDLSIQEGDSIAASVNAAFDYGDGKHSVALQHGLGPSRHLHLQVRNETRRKVANDEPIEKET